MKCIIYYLAYPSLAPKYALSQKDRFHKKRMIVNRNHDDPSKPSEDLVAVLTIPKTKETMPRRLAIIAIRACNRGPNPKSMDLTFSGISAIALLLLSIGYLAETKVTDY